MAVVDPVADMLTRIRNAHQAYHRQVDIPASKMKASIAGILKEEGYIEDYSVDGASMQLALKYVDGKPLISGLKKVSKPGRRIYVGVSEIPRVQNGLGICILSTSRGLMAGAKAAEGNLGGELVCEIW
ncbi:MAG TPA: 30S ribosomal protein S8 [Desulfovibrio sp.]|jgi:small subunit ribosomal protein S8|uniref:30S ribosomal protein S8 n=1 Tax=Desulfovibrio TaxID=872 RepID=UPI00041772D0|nr:MULTISPECIES: 30S ribosomal protein S8 [Desulfovibrio]MDY0305398.1 30S ribosomal protein S8 [Desulfovibrionaceae bacterium]HMM37838.1 30S ribosomal protein S8 [Desulfovibrio sp.]